MTGGSSSADTSVPHKRRRTSKKKRASLEPIVELTRDNPENSQDHSTNQDTAQTHDDKSSLEGKEEPQQQQVPVDELTQVEEQEQVHPIQYRTPAQLPKEDQQIESNSEDAVNTKQNQLLNECERRRRENIIRNQAFMRNVGVSAARALIGDEAAKEAAKEAKRQQLAGKRALKAARLAELMKKPLRKSRRLRGQDAEDEISTVAARLLCTNKVHGMDVFDEEGREFLKTIGGHSEKESKFEESETSLEDNDVEYSLKNNDVVRVTPYTRITAMTFLPRADRVVVACGDKEGLVSFWAPSDRGNNGTVSSSAVLYRPHGYAVTELIFPTSSNMISSSLDGTVCEFDLWSSKTSLLCDISYEAGITSLAKSDNPQLYYASCNDGTVRLIDRRERNLYKSGFKLHKLKINTVDQHPILDYCIATAGQDCKVCFWDKRKIASEQNVPIAQLQYRTERSCAQFSRDDGARLVTLGYDAFIDMYDTSSLIKCKVSDALPDIPAPIRIPHNNCTGTITKFRPAWDPKRPDRFVIGCWGEPSRLEIYRAGHVQPIRELVREKASTANFDVVTKYHPYLDLIASGNSTGRLSVWRAKKK